MRDSQDSFYTLELISKEMKFLLNIDQATNGSSLKKSLTHLNRKKNVWWICVFKTEHSGSPFLF